MRTIGKVGSGPGEYSNIEDFAIDETTQNIVVLCFPSTVIIYNSQGQFVSQKKLTPSALFWNICSFRDGYIFSTNHQSVLEGDEAFLLFLYDKEFNLQRKMLSVLPSYIQMPPFISNPLQNTGDRVSYFDTFTSNIYLNVNQASYTTINLDLGKKEAPLNLYADPQVFFTKQSEYCFFLEAMIADEILFTSFANCGKRYISIVNLKSNKKTTIEKFTWFPDRLLFFKDKYFYSSSSALSIVEKNNSLYKKGIANYPIEADSNPVILRFKFKKTWK